MTGLLILLISLLLAMLISIPAANGIVKLGEWLDKKYPKDKPNRVEFNVYTEHYKKALANMNLLEKELKEARTRIAELEAAARYNHDCDLEWYDHIGVPECPLHGGYCKPHVNKWIEEKLGITR
jgi:hypothetical protein